MSNIFQNLIPHKEKSSGLNTDLLYRSEFSGSLISNSPLLNVSSLPTITIAASDSSAAEVVSGQTANPGAFSITRTGPTTSALSVNYTVAGTATKGVDYNNITGNTANTGTITIAAGATSATLNLNVIDDSAIEGNETVILSLGTNTAYSLGSTTSATVNIADNDKPVITISPSDSSAAEVVNGQTANPGVFTITRTGPTTSALSVNYTVAGTATKGFDYNNITGNTANTGTITIAAGATSATLNLNVIDDSAIEGNETVILSLGTNTAYSLGSTTSATVNIADNDKPVITISASDSSAAEVVNGQTANPGVFTITRTGPTTSALSVNYTVAGTATKGFDYNNITGNTANTGTITIAAGATSATLNLNVIDDSAIEGNETVILSLGTNTAYSLGSTTSATVNIADNDKPVITISPSDSSAAEVVNGQTANPGVFTITRTGPTTSALSVSYTVGGTATKGSDYNNITGNTANTGTITIPVGATSITLPINVIDDTVVEGNETVILSLGSNSAYSLGSTTSATVNIADNDKPVITISASDSSAAEVVNGQTANPGVFTITRTGPTTSALSVNYTVAGTATKGFDYNNITGNTANTGTITIAAGATSATLNLNVIDDSAIEGNETVILSLGTNTAYSLGSTTSATVNIADNDKPVITISPSDSSAAEVVSGQTANPGVFTITRTGPTTSALTVNYTVAGTATKGVDYNNITGNSANTGTITIAAGATSATLNLNVIDDSAIEGNETVILSLGTNTAYSLGSTTSATVNIADNDTIVDPVAGRFTSTGNNDIDGLLSPLQYYWNTSNNGGIITYSFYSNSAGSYYGSETVSEVSNAIKNSVRDILVNLSTYINVRFVEVADTANSYGVIRYMYSNGYGDSDFYAYAYYPGSSAVTGDVHLNRNFESDPTNAFSQGYGSYGYLTLIHETLHALGLKHPGDYNGSGTGAGPFLLPEQDNNTNTVMTYNGGGGNPTTVMAYDIRALQYLYGTKINNSTNTTYNFRYIDSYSVNGTFFGTDQYDIKQTIWDSGGVDTFDLSALDASGSYVMDLTQGGILTRLSNYENEYYQDRTTGGYYTTSGLGTTIAYNSIIENVINSRGNDYIQGNEAANTFKGYATGTFTGNDVYYLTTSSDTLELTGYSLSNITTTISGNNLTINLGSYGSIEVKEYFSTSNSSMRFQIGGNYYRYNRTSGWQSVSAFTATNFNVNHVYQTGGLTARQLSESEIAKGDIPVIACQCNACSGNRPVSIGTASLMEAVGMFN